MTEGGESREGKIGLSAYRFRYLVYANFFNDIQLFPVKQHP